MLIFQGNWKLSPAEWHLESYQPSESEIVGNPTNLTFDKKGLLSLKDALWDATVTGASKRYYNRVTLDDDRGLRGYIYEANGWNIDWKTLDDLYQVQGQCGLNDIYRLNSNNSPKCSFPPRFNFLDADKHFKGCFRSLPQQNYREKIMMQDIGNTDWPGNDYPIITDISETTCKQACLEDCMCIVVVYGHPSNDKSICWKEAIPLRCWKYLTPLSIFGYCNGSKERKHKHTTHSQEVLSTQMGKYQTLKLQKILQRNKKLITLYVACLNA